MVAIFGRLPVVTPVFVYAAVMAAAGMMLVPPLVATITKTRPFVRPSLETALGLFAMAITAGLAYVAPAYTHEEPLRRAARAVQEGDGPAIWDVGSVEPGVDLGEGAPPGWMPAAHGADGYVPFGAFRIRSSFARPDPASARRRSRSLRSPSSRSRPAPSWP